MKKEESNENIRVGIFKGLAYKAGFICAKTAKLKNIADTGNRKKAFSAIESFFTKANRKTTDLFENAKDSASEMKDSFKAGFKFIEKKKIDEAGGAYKDKVEEKEPKTEKVSSTKKKKRVKTDMKEGLGDSTKKASRQKDSQKIEGTLQESLNADFEKEIEEITQGVAET